jgi:hypothetical protein
MIRRLLRTIGRNFRAPTPVIDQGLAGAIATAAAAAAGMTWEQPTSTELVGFEWFVHDNADRLGGNTVVVIDCETAEIVRVFRNKK